MGPRQIRWIGIMLMAWTIGGWAKWTGHRVHGSAYLVCFAICWIAALIFWGLMLRLGYGLATKGKGEKDDSSDN